MSKQKGDNNERRLEELYVQAGWKTERSQGTRWGRTDWFGIFDVMAVHPKHPVRFVQVKSNTASGVRKVFEKADRLLPAAHASAEYAVKHDKAGWRLLRPVERDGGVTYRTVYDERKDASVGPYVDTPKNLGEGLLAFLKDETF